MGRAWRMVPIREEVGRVYDISFCSLPFLAAR